MPSTPEPPQRPTSAPPATNPLREPRYRIGAVVRATGIAADTLRVWERRYTVLEPARSEKGGRLYSDADIARLRLLKQLLDRGHAIGRLARLPDDELSAILTRHGGAPPAAAGSQARADWAGPRQAFLEAVARDDLESAQGILSRAALTLPARELALQVIAPLLREVGDRWAQGTLCVAHEHAASSLVRSSLGAVLGTLSAAGRGGRDDGAAAPTLIATTPPGELHEFGALLSAVLAAAAGWRVIYLGPNLPAGEIIDAAARTRADVVALSVLAGTGGEGAAELRRLAAELPAHVALVAGGTAAAHPELARRAHVLAALEDLPAWLDEQRRRLAAG